MKDSPHSTSISNGIVLLAYKAPLQMEPRKASYQENRPLLTASSLSLTNEHGSTSVTLNQTSMQNPTVDDEQGRTQADSFDPHGGKDAASARTTNWQTMMHLLKSNLGTGILAMPDAFSNAGLLVGTLGIPFMGLICIHCMHILVNCSKNLSKRLGMRSLDYAHVVYYAFKFGPERIQKFAKTSRRVVNFFLLLTQFGFCCVYFVFVATSVDETVKSILGEDRKSPISFTAYTSLILPFMILLNMLRSLRTLAIFSTFANILQFVGLGIVFYNIMTGLPHVSERPLAVSISRLPLYFGVAVYAFEGIGVVLPLENKMKSPEDFGGLSGVLNTGMVLVSCLYTAMGFYGYLKYGDKAKGSVTLNLGPGALNESVRLMFALAIFLSYAIQMYVPMQIIWPIIKERLRLEERFGDDKTRYLEYAFRSLCVMGTYVFAISIPDLKLFISLVGALASSSLALIIPPILEVVTYWDEDYTRAQWFAIMAKNIFIGTFGLLGFATGTYATIESLINHNSTAES